jgi:flagellar biosynthesis/type III secretory pathway protein FliH
MFSAAVPPRPAVVSAAGASAWAPQELTPFDALDAPAPGGLPTTFPSADELRAAIEADHRRAASAERAALEAEHQRQLQEAYAAGVADGEAAGRAAESARLHSALLAAEGAAALLREGDRRWTATLEENVCALAVAVARQVIGRELVGDVAALTDLVRRALSEFPLDQAIVVRVHPADLAALAGAATAGSAGDLVAPNRETRWIADANVPAGGCVLEGRERIVDGRVDTALERVYRQLTGNHA